MEHFFRCPNCGEQISIVLDMSVRSQTYIEDCEVCCRPIQIRYVVHHDDIVEFQAQTAK
ncbi:MAG: CPXCG motif-containing cysteine-rich protein [Acidobacteria bacterium]|nr:MAG: CPXCG motif-containing cysteine-rich protein [Acidobacteriota bacterium]